MITENDIIRVSFSDYDVVIAGNFASQAEIGGSSSIRATDDRTSNLSQDQLVGQIATLAWHKYYYGAIDEYLKQRYVQNLFPFHGDGGSDMIGANLDVKGSALKRKHRSPLDYYLLVRPREYKHDTVYVQSLIDICDSAPITAMLTGWATGAMLTERVDERLFGDAYGLRVRDLMPLIPIRFSWFTNGAK